MLPVAKTGMRATMQEIAVISNNIANASSAGFKRSRAMFSDIYGGELSGGMQDVKPGLGVRQYEPRRAHEQGSFRATGAALDLAVNGNGMFAVKKQNGDDMMRFTRNGAIELTADGLLVTSEGYQYMSTDLEPIRLPFAVLDNNNQERRLSKVDVKDSGLIEATYGQDFVVNIGELTLAQFRDPGALKAEGRNFFLETRESGAPVFTRPLDQGAGNLQSGYIETSNVDLTEEMTMLLRSQQAFSAVSRMVQSDVEAVRKFTS